MIAIVKEGKESYRFQVINKGGQVVFRSKTFPSEEKVKSEIRGYPGLLAKPGYVERRTDHQGRFLFCLRNEAGKIIGKSTPYGSEAGMENAIKNFKSLLRTH